MVIRHFSQTGWVLIPLAGQQVFRSEPLSSNNSGDPIFSARAAFACVRLCLFHGTNLNTHTADHLAAVTAELNDPSRHTGRALRFRRARPAECCASKAYPRRAADRSTATSGTVVSAGAAIGPDRRCTRANSGAVRAVVTNAIITMIE